VDESGKKILLELQGVAEQRALRTADPALAASVEAVKAFQHRRFAHTYADMLAHPRFGPAARFFLADLYGPSDFSARDTQFARVVPALVRLFPRELVSTVGSLAALHALSERLDSLMGVALCGKTVDAASYTEAWRACGTPADREQQIVLTGQVGASLERYTRNPLLRHSLRMMRGPAQAAGLGALQRFLETGFDTFKEMRGSGDFLQAIAQRERATCDALFSGRSEVLPEL